ncbi:class I SAM-dependent methyltransferase [Curtobacterium sp. Leaf261]|uniref:class I SAM-dependent methyltransferase n=1 Tax=Curtobacterium sp. Leaf261 TaxID=1736311 RepID=UPI0006F23FD2|nr:class I SAM-dependent methyltransferase [Curtobacterium sp. Leaf261]KQO64987.1 hypothetical protein ASF23_02210 [Curtobacterium sp. Leaf261]
MAHHGHHDTRPDSDDPTTYWDARYGEQDAMWRFRPNAVLATEAVRFTPGSALDLGAGEGGDALWLADRGWTVRAVDISRVALDRGAATARERGLDGMVRWEQADLTTWVPDETFDLVTSHFLHSPVALDEEAILRTATTAVAPGGHLLVVKHGEVPGGAPVHAGRVFPGPEDVVVQLELDPAAWSVDLAERRPRDATLPDGTTVRTEDVVVLATRTASRSEDEDGESA